MYSNGILKNCYVITSKSSNNYHKNRELDDIKKRQLCNKIQRIQEISLSLKFKSLKVGK